MDGIINICKEQHFTSSDVVAKLRGICHMRKIGHTGTLDPMATGVLPVCLGNATKLCEMLTDHDKVYETVLLLGKMSDTQDIWGEVSDTGYDFTIPGAISEDKIRDVIAGYVGEYDQIPPMYSAKKINGKKLCDLARGGVNVERKPVRVKIYDIEILEINIPRIRLKVHCGKGTYIRTLCHDIGEDLGCMAVMESLVRKRVGQFDLESAVTLLQVQECMDCGRIDSILIPTDRFFDEYPKVVLDEEYDKPVHNGNPLPTAVIGGKTNDNTRYRIYDSQNCFIGVYEFVRAKNRLMPYKLFLGQ